MTIEELRNLLEKHHIPIAKWELGTAKNIADLHREVLNGEIQLGIVGEVLTRQVSVTGIYVEYFPAEQKPYRNLLLKEHIQVLETNGKGRIRIRNKPTSISEKMKPGETPEQTARRGLFEELGFKNHNTYKLSPLATEETTKDSESYPGLPKKQKMYYFRCIISESLFHPDGYKEVKKNQTTLFEWVPILENRLFPPLEIVR